MYDEINELVRKAKKGDSTASAELLSRMKPLLLATIRRHNIRHSREDLLQEASLSLLEGIQAYDEKTGIPFPAYIKTKLNFDIYNICRKERKYEFRTAKADTEEKSPLEWIMDEKADTEAQVIKKEETYAVKEALGKLEPKYRQVLVLHFFEKLSLKHIALITGVSYKTVQRYKSRGLSEMAARLNPYRGRQPKT